MKGVDHTLTEDDYVELGKASEMYSGSDIKNVAKEALYMPIRKCQQATTFKVNQDGMFTPCSPSDPNGQKMGMYDVPSGKLKEPPVCVDDFFQALTKQKPSVGPDDLKPFEEWTEQFGQEGS